MKTEQAELTQMLRGQMSARLPQANMAELSLETPLEDLGLDSQDKLCLLFEIEDLFDVAIPDATASQMKCGTDILAYTASSQRGPSHKLRGWRETLSWLKLLASTIPCPPTCSLFFAP